MKFVHRASTVEIWQAGHPWEDRDKPCPGRQNLRLILPQWVSVAIALCAAMFTLAVVMAAVEEPTDKAQRPNDLTDFSLEDLMNLEVTSVSKREQKLSTAPSAIYVITSEDLRRSGATTIPEALRMVPGLDVARIDSDRWAISARGFNERFSNKMLVMIDGRSVYTPTFSGVYWDVQDTLLEDIERIEVIRGPGGTLWGANAVNGVINIITKSAKDTQGGLITGGGGFEDRGFGGARYGGKIGQNAYYRVYGKYFLHKNIINSAMRLDEGHWDSRRGGFRVDWKASNRDSLTFQGDLYSGTSKEHRWSLMPFSPPFSEFLEEDLQVSGSYAQGRWTRTFSDRSSLVLQLYHDRTFRIDSDRNPTTRGETVHTSDIDFQHRLALGSRHDLVWGLGYRFMRDTSHNSLSVTFDPDERATQLVSGFVQDEVRLAKDVLYLTIGSKLEHSSYSRFELQPNLRLRWTPQERHTFWAAVARAVRTPSRTDWDQRRINSSRIDSDGLLRLSVSLGNRNFKSETLLAYEVGYRVQPRPRLALDIATFFNRYDDLHTNKRGDSYIEEFPLPRHRVAPRYAFNNLRGTTSGVEFVVSWNATAHWKLSSSYSWLGMALHIKDPAQGTQGESAEGNSPKHQAQIRSYLSLPRHIEFDTTLYYVDRLSNQDVPRYTRLDARLGWRLIDKLEASLGLQNALDDRHPEFSNRNARASQVKRSIYGKLTWRF
ncbi:MAG: TonB-dependent receptor [Acidobacteria bacterium]|nr:TonB-dependent receptor [Acidobacteriota bacterium]